MQKCCDHNDVHIHSLAKTHLSLCADVMVGNPLQFHPCTVCVNCTRNLKIESVIKLYPQSKNRKPQIKLTFALEALVT